MDINQMALSEGAVNSGTRAHGFPGQPLVGLSIRSSETAIRSLIRGGEKGYCLMTVSVFSRCIACHPKRDKRNPVPPLF
jgi:hypothetical protein